MGDTDMFCDMALIAEFYEPDIGIVPIGDRFTMGARWAASPARSFLTFEMILPVHYATFPGMLGPERRQIRSRNGGHNVVVPKVGQALTV